MGRITWVCATCAQHFTREYGADRHNNNLHEGKGTIVRLLDYIVGRINGQFLPNDPLAYRRKKGKEKKKNLLFGSNHNSSNNNNFEPKVISESTDDILSYENVILNPPSRTDSIYHSNDGNNTYQRPYHSNRVLQPLHKMDNDTFYADKLVERKLKLAEFKILLNKYYPPQTANEIFASAAILFIQGDDDFVDKKLTLLRNIDRAKFGYS